MAQAFGLLLADKVHIGHIRHIPDGLGLLVLPVGQQAALQIGGIVKVVLNGGLAPVGDDQDLFHAGRNSLFHDILQNRLVHQRQHFLGDALGVGQQPGTQAGGGDDGFPDFHGFRSLHLVFIQQINPYFQRPSPPPPPAGGAGKIRSRSTTGGRPRTARTVRWIGSPDPAF